VADAGQVQSKDVEAEGRPAPRERDVEAVRADAVHGPGAGQDDGRERPRRRDGAVEDAEERVTAAERDGMLAWRPDLLPRRPHPHGPHRREAQRRSVADLTPPAPLS